MSDAGPDPKLSGDAPRDRSAFQRTCESLNAMLSARIQTPSIETFFQFGTHGYSVTVAEEHVDYLSWLQQLLKADAAASSGSLAFHPEMLRRWEATNELLINFYRPPTPVPERLRLEFPGLAALVAFPLLEEVAGRICRAWEQDGTLVIDVPKSLGLVRVDKNGVRQPHSYKRGHRIVDLSHKLFVMKCALPEDLQTTIESLDRAMSVPFVEGEPAVHIPFFERLEHFRNLWLHGRRFEGIEAWLLTFFLAMLYFRLPEDTGGRWDLDDIVFTLEEGYFEDGQFHSQQTRTLTPEEPADAD